MPFIDAIIYIFLFLFFFLPYNVDRPARRPPYVTYALMGLNTFLFFVTVFISNVNLPADREYGRQEASNLIRQYSEKYPEAKSDIDMAKSLDGDIKEASYEFKNDKDADEDKGTFSVFSKEGGKKLARYFMQRAAMRIAAERAADGDGKTGYRRLWQIEYMNSSYVVTPHYSALEWFAYRPGERSIPVKLLGLLGCMFLHADFFHILGNMLFLWVFGRAVEDALGPRVYLGAYLLCGVAATLLNHIMTIQFNPTGLFVPTLGASGAIAGVMGLFAPRFYRTPVRVFYLTVLAKIVAGLAGGFLAAILLMITRDLVASLVFAGAAVLVGLYYFGKDWGWGGTKIPAAWFLGFHLGIFDLKPAVQSLFGSGDTGDGTAHWAHIGGFLFGMLYAFLIGSQKEGKQEFLLEDAEKAYGLGDMAGAVTYAQNILEREPGNPGAYDILGKAYMKQNNENDALDNFELAIENYLRVGERGKAAAAYIIALEKFPRFILQPATQLAIGNQMAKNYSFQEAAETLVKIPYTFPDASEGEVALLRSSQIYLQYLNQPQTTVQLLQFFVQKYPESTWMPQVERAWKMAHHQLMMPAEPEVVEEVPQEVMEPARIRPQAVAPVLELETEGQQAPGGYSTQSAPPPTPKTQPMPPQGGAQTQGLPPRPPGR